MLVFNKTKGLQLYGPWKLKPNEWTDLPDKVAQNFKGARDFQVAPDHLVDEQGLHLGWSSPFHYADGYGSIAQEMAATFLDMGIKLSIYPRDYDPSKPAFGGVPLEEWESKAFVPGQIVEQLRQEQPPVAYGINMTWPREVHQRPFPWCIGLTMFETTQPPRSWAEPMNKCRRIIVPCKQNKEAFEGIGVKVPIHVVPLGVDPKKWRFVDRAGMGRAGPLPKFTFLMSAGLTYRKNPVGAAKAFVAAFPREGDVRLILKTRGAQSSGGFWTWASEIPDDPRIEVVREESTPYQMYCWMAVANAFVFPSKGEGFGLTPLQAMATGLPVIVADNSGMSEYCDARYNYPVHCHEIPVPPGGSPQGYPADWGDVGNWWEPSFDQLVDRYREVYTYPEIAYARGKDAAAWVRRKWTVRRTCEGILKVVIQDAKVSGAIRW